MLDHALIGVCAVIRANTVSKDLTWKKHVDHTAAKASRTLGFLHSNLRDCWKEVRAAAYNTMVQSALDYAFTCTSWDPHTKDEINTLAKVQRRGA